MKKTKQQQVSQNRYEVLMERYEKFTANLTNMDVAPVSVFDPLPPKAMAELELIREVSKTLQAKKVEDLRKAKEAAEADKSAEEKTEEKTDEEVKENSEEDKKEDK